MPQLPHRAPIRPLRENRAPNGPRDHLAGNRFQRLAALPEHGAIAVNSLPYIDADTLTSLLSWAQAIDALEQFLRTGVDLAGAPPRGAVPTAHGELLLMSAESAEAVGFKLVSVAPDNPGIGLPRIQALYTLLDAPTLTPRVLVDGTALTSLRTPALSALAASRLAVADARTLTVFGAGPQARAHVHALSSVRPVERVRIVARNADRAAKLAAQLSEEGFPATAGTADSVRTADIVVCATTSSVPVFDGSLLADQACVLAVGSHHPDRRELDERVFARAERIVVEERAAALREAGDVILAMEIGACAADDLIDVAELMVLPPSSGLSVFKSVGMGWEDLVVAEAAYARWLGPAKPPEERSSETVITSATTARRQWSTVRTDGGKGWCR